MLVTTSDHALEAELTWRAANADASHTPADKRALEVAARRLEMLQIVPFASSAGEPFPDFALPDASGAIHASHALLDRGPLVLAFFRGGFCPFCDAVMHAYDAIAATIAAAGGILVGVMPERADVFAATIAAKRVGFLMLRDPGARLARLTGLQFDLTEAQIAYCKARGLDIAARNDGCGWTLALPAVFVIGGDGIVAAVFAEPDCRRRAGPDAILDALASLRASGRP